MRRTSDTLSTKPQWCSEACKRNGNDPAGLVVRRGAAAAAAAAAASMQPTRGHNAAWRRRLAALGLQQGCGAFGGGGPSLNHEQP